jgi:hypothetical protein
MQKQIKIKQHPHKGRKRQSNLVNYVPRIVGGARNINAFRTLVTATTSDINTGGTGSQGFSFYLNYPSYYRNPAGANAQMSNVPTSLGNEMKMFDEYQVQSLTVELLPFMNLQTLAAGTTVVDPTVVLATDNDDSALLTTYAKAINSQGRAIFTILSNRRIVRHQRNEGPESALRWGNCQNNTPSAPDPETPLMLSSIKAFVPAYGAANQPKGLWVATWDICYRGIYTLQ